MRKKLTSSSTKLRVVVDTNVFVSAFVWGGNPRKVVGGWLKSNYLLLMSPFLLAEILLTLERFGFGDNDLGLLKQILELQTVKVLPKKLAKICRDKKDNQVLDLCREGKANYLVSGDENLLVLKEYEGTKIVKSREFIQILRKL